MYERHLGQLLKDSLADTPAVLLVGSRQVGKSTLVGALRNDDYSPSYLTFDDPTLLLAARSNPIAFLESVRLPVVFDEIQRVPELLLPIKMAIDKDRRPGNYLLTGSANVMLLPEVADSLAGRIEIIALRGLSQGEITGVRENFIDRVCADDFEIPVATATTEDREALFSRILSGGYPEVLARPTETRRTAWFGAYVTSLIQRDVRDLANIDGLADFPRLLSILATRAGGLLNFSEVSRIAAIPQTTLKRYIALLENLFLIEYLPAYSGSLTKRVMKTPKLYFQDTGLLAHLLGHSWERIKFEPTATGVLTENFVVSELRKQLSWNETRAEMLHFRTTSGQEVDVVLELPGGSVIGIEVKSAASIGGDAFKGLRALADQLGPRFKRGIVLYTGDAFAAFDSRMYAVPIRNLWAAD